MISSCRIKCCFHYVRAVTRRAKVICYKCCDIAGSTTGKASGNFPPSVSPAITIVCYFPLRLKFSDCTICLLTKNSIHATAVYDKLVRCVIIADQKSLQYFNVIRCRIVGHTNTGKAFNPRFPRAGYSLGRNSQRKYQSDSEKHGHNASK